MVPYLLRAQFASSDDKLFVSQVKKCCNTRLTKPHDTVSGSVAAEANASFTD